MTRTRNRQLMMYEYAIIGMWCYGGVVTGYMEYTNDNSTSDRYFDTFAVALLSTFQVSSGRTDSDMTPSVCDRMHWHTVMCSKGTRWSYGEQSESCQREVERE